MGGSSGEVKTSSTSKNGDIHEALNEAIQKAKDGLPSDFVRWTLLELAGENGGIVGQQDVSVTISAKGPQ